MDSDEAVALGAGLHAANLSTAFRVRKFGAVDVATYGLSVHHSGEAAEESAEEVRIFPESSLNVP
jgi:hypoxia up-regulated 1